MTTLTKPKKLHIKVKTRAGWAILESIDKDSPWFPLGCRMENGAVFWLGVRDITAARIAHSHATLRELWAMLGLPAPPLAIRMD